MTTGPILSPHGDLSSLLPLYCCLITPKEEMPLLPNSRVCSLNKLTTLKKVKSMLNELDPGEKGILCYQEKGVELAAQVWWLLQVVGCPHVFVLDGGLHAYQSHGGIVTTQPPLEPQLTDATEVEIDRSRYKTDAEVRELVSESARNVQMLDTEGRYLGAVNCPASLLMGDGWTMGDSEALKLVLAGIGAKYDPLSTTIVIGKGAPIVLLALSSLSMHNLCLGIVNRESEEFLEVPVLERIPRDVPPSANTEFYSFQSGNTEFFDALDDIDKKEIFTNKASQGRDSLVATRSGKITPKVVHPKEKGEIESQHQCSGCELY